MVNNSCIFRNSPITRYLSTPSSSILLEPVPLTVPQYCHFEKKGRNDILMKIRLGKVEVTFFHSINQETFQQLQTLR
ncbi:hypothetical protein EI219_11335 [Streptococcus suis]|uniref:Uncharacterized protein n=1 Tax=Streptococcus suis TaxID=1307 RepID=A0A3R8NXU7_STRSU|nr:hypothetical protein EI219_11335 [Streptococcus suis]